MRAATGVGVLVSLTVGAHHASADPIGLELGARAAFGLPLGKVDATPGDRQDQTIANSVPLWLDLGWRFAPRWQAGAYAVYAPGNPGDALKGSCPQCSVEDARFGLEAAFHISPAQPWDPWLGYGMGVEVLNVRNSAGSAGAVGPELLHLQFGADYRVVNELRLGPFVAFSLGAYANLNTAADFHEWLTAGIKVTYDPAKRGSSPAQPSPWEE